MIDRAVFGVVDLLRATTVMVPGILVARIHSIAMTVWAMRQCLESALPGSGAVHKPTLSMSSVIKVKCCCVCVLTQQFTKKCL